MSWIEEQTDEAVEQLCKIMDPKDLKEFFESYWPDEETVVEYGLQKEKDAFTHAISGFYDNNHDSNGETGIDMICAMVDHIVKKVTSGTYTQEEWDRIAESWGNNSGG